MALNTRDIIVFDFETGSRNPLKTQPTQIAAVVIHGKSLKLKEGGMFNSEMKPILDDEEAVAAGLDPIEDEALDITRKTRKALAKAPTPKYVWRKFGKFCAMHNWKGTSWFNPIAAGCGRAFSLLMFFTFFVAVYFYISFQPLDILSPYSTCS